MTTLSNASAVTTIPMTVDQKTKIISIGKWSTTGILYNRMLTGSSEHSTHLKETILEANGIVLPLDSLRDEGGVKRVNQEISKYLGSMFYKRIMAISMELWLDPIKELVDDYCFYSNGWRHYYHQDQVKRLWKFKRIVDTAIDDETYNIIPLLIFFGATPKRLKSAFGKGLWKKLANNSKARNMQLILWLELLEHAKSSRRRTRIGSVRKFETFTETLSILVDLKSCLLRDQGLRDDIHNPRRFPGLHVWLNTYAKVSCKDDVKRKTHLYSDTYRMAIEANAQFKPVSPKKMKQRHDALAKALLTRSYTETPFPWLKELQKEFTLTDGSITLLDSPFAIAKEGEEMKHCVASYIFNVADTDYVVFSLSSPNGNRSTIGYGASLTSLGADSVGTKKKFFLHQHYGIFNDDVNCPHLLGLQSFLDKNINRLLSGGKIVCP